MESHSPRPGPGSRRPAPALACPPRARAEVEAEGPAPRPWPREQRAWARCPRPGETGTGGVLGTGSHDSAPPGPWDVCDPRGAIRVRAQRRTDLQEPQSRAWAGSTPRGPLRPGAAAPAPTASLSGQSLSVRLTPHPLLPAPSPTRARLRSRPRVGSAGCCARGTGGDTPLWGLTLMGDLHFLGTGPLTVTGGILCPPVHPSTWPPRSPERGLGPELCLVRCQEFNFVGGVRVVFLILPAHF